MIKNYPILKKIVPIIFLLFSVTAFSQTTGDFRSIATGNWTDLTRWQYFNGTAWVNPSGTNPQGYPGQFAGTGTVTIQNSNNITINTNITNSFTALVIGGGVSGILTVGADVNISTLSTIINAGGLMKFSGQNDITFPAGASIQIISPGKIDDGGTCTNNVAVYIGTVKYAVCTGSGNADFSFDQLNSGGGSLKSNPSYNSPVCGNIISLIGAYTGVINNNKSVTYLWTATGPSSVTFNSNTNASPIATINPSTYPSVYTFTLKVTNDGNSNSKTIYVTVNAIPATPTINASGPLTFCSGGSVTLTSSAGSSYLWSTGATTASINVSTAGSYTVRVTNASGCQSATSAITAVTVNPLPVASGTITGTPTVCQGQNAVTYSVPAITNATSYTWLYSGTGATISGSTRSMTINFSANATSGNLTVRGANACGNGTISANYAITINPTSVGGTASANQTICFGSAPANITLSGQTGTIQWQSSTDNITFNNISGATSTPLTSAQMGTLNSTRYYRAVVTSGVCSSSTSTTVTVAVSPVSVGGAASANQTICSGSAPVNITLSGQTGTIQWQSSTDNITFNNISGATSTPLTSAQMGTLNSTRYYRAVVTSGVCSSSTSTPTTVTVNPFPTTPIVGAITQPTCSLSTGSAILSDLPSGNWTINPGAISGSGTSTTISGLAAGTYNYIVTNAAGCTSTASANVVISAPPAINVWNGSVSTDWNNSTNWCTGVPSVSNNIDVLIPTNPTGGRYPKINIEPAASGYVNNIVFEIGTTLIIENNTLFIDGSLTLNGRIDLNNEAQLVQGALSTFVAASTGSIEIDQQGTSDNFKYNYWGSPVNSTGTAYTIAGVLRDGTDPNAFPLTPITFGTPYAFADGVAPFVGEAIKLSTYWMYKYANLGNGYSGWTSVGKDGSLKIGEGFTMKGSNTNLSEQNYSFVGKPNNGDIALPIAANRNYLIGNPYPSALDAKEFIRDNIAAPSGHRTSNVIDGNLYFWDHFGGGNHLLKSYEGGYGIVNLTGEIKAMASDALINNTGNESTKIPPRFIPVAQGFFVTAVSGIVGTENIQFKNSQRIFKKENPAISQFMKSAKYSKSNKETINEDVFPKIFLKYSSPKGFHRQVLVGFIENTTDGVDIGFDAINHETFAEDMSWRTNNINFIIQAVSSLNDERVLPLEVKVATLGIIKISIDDAENIPEDTEIFMKDNTTGEMHNISHKPFEIELTAGKYTDRFALTFKTQKLLAEDVKAEILIPAIAQPIIEGIHVFMNNAIGELQIKNNSTEEIVSVALINSLGQMVNTWNSNFNIRTISLPISTATGVYLVQINTKTGNTVKKISVE